MGPWHDGVIKWKHFPRHEWKDEPQYMTINIYFVYRKEQLVYWVNLTFNISCCSYRKINIFIRSYFLMFCNNWTLVTWANLWYFGSPEPSLQQIFFTRFQLWADKHVASCGCLSQWTTWGLHVTNRKPVGGNIRQSVSNDVNYKDLCVSETVNSTTLKFKTWRVLQNLFNHQMAMHEIADLVGSSLNIFSWRC